jgi:hypothetical protein
VKVDEWWRAARADAPLGLGLSRGWWVSDLYYFALQV